ncbi:hypothetical protein [Thermaurantiacus sp.]
MAEELLDCDLVLRGGVTSGVVYPGTLYALSRRYRLRRIGGASAGAIAAGIAAAAEYGRARSNGARDPFATLIAHLPEEVSGLATPGGAPGTSFRKLFRPAERFGPLMAFLFDLAAAGEGQRGPVIRRAALGLLRQELGPILLTLLGLGLAILFPLFFLLGGATTWLQGALSGALSLLFLVAAIAGWLMPLLLVLVRLGAGRLLDEARSVLHHFQASGYGLCAGVNPALADHSDPARWRGEGALSDWLHAVIQDAAGLPLDQPLTFGDLWGHRDPWASRQIDLYLTASNLSQQLPAELPFLERPRSFLYFTEADLAQVLPKPVVRHLVAMAPADLRLERDGAVFHRLPAPADLPILLGIRMSLAFPGLLAAVRLHETFDWAPPRDEEAGRAPADDRRNAASRALRSCWFSDGGITSNFPVSTFDDVFPGCPTFCINLADLSPDNPDPSRRVWMPRNNSEAIRAPHLADLDRAGLLGFLGAIVSTARNGHENELMRAPSQRDRIVNVLLDPRREGGLNLAMDGRTIAAMAGWGREAGELLVKRFHPQGGGDPEAPGMDWANHRWGRIRTVLAAAEAFAVRFTEGWSFADPAGQTPQSMLASSWPGRSYRWRNKAGFAAAKDTAEDLAAALGALASAVGNRPDGSIFDGIRSTDPQTPLARDGGAPRPTLRLRMRPSGRDPRRS